MRHWLRDARPPGPVGVLLDRDGTLTVDPGYVYRIQDLELLPSAATAVARLASLRLPTAIVTNQAGIALGRFTDLDSRRFNAALIERIDTAGGRIDGVYACPHLEARDLGPGEAPCPCSKPLPGLLHEAAADLGLDLAQSWMIGDRMSDVAAGRAAGCRTILVLTGLAGSDRAVEAGSAATAEPDAVAGSLLEAVDVIAAASPSRTA